MHQSERFPELLGVVCLSLKITAGVKSGNAELDMMVVSVGGKRCLPTDFERNVFTRKERR